MTGNGRLLSPGVRSDTAAGEKAYKSTYSELRGESGDKPDVLSPSWNRCNARVDWTVHAQSGDATDGAREREVGREWESERERERGREGGTEGGRGSIILWSPWRPRASLTQTGLYS